MPAASDGEVVSSYKFSIDKNGREFIYEMKLLRYKPNNTYCFMRRWYYKDRKYKPSWQSGGWDFKNLKAFERKVVQKRDIMKYKILESTQIK